MKILFNAPDFFITMKLQTDKKIKVETISTFISESEFFIIIGTIANI